MSNDNEVSNNIETTTSVDTAQTTIDNTVKNSNKKSKLIPFCVVLLVVLCLCAGGFYYYFSTPKKIVTSVINKAYGDYDEMVNNKASLDFTKEAFKIKGDLNIDTNIDGFENIKKDTFAYTVGLDYPNKKVEVGGSVVEGKTTLIDIMAYIIDKNMYVSLKDDYKNLISIDSSEYDFDELFDLEQLENLDISKDDINYIVKAYKDILINAIDEEDLEKSNDTLEIDGKDTKVTKISYKINQKNSEKLVKNIIDGALKDEKLLKIFSKLSDTDVKDIKDALKDAKNEIDIPSDLKMTLNIYTKGFNNKFVGLDLKIEDSTINVVVNKESTKIKANIEGVNITLDVKEYSENEVNVDYKIKTAGQTVEGNLTVTEKETQKNNYEGSFSFDIKYDTYKLAIKANYSLEVGTSIADINTNKAVNLEDASDDLEDVMERIEKRLEKSELYNSIENMVTSISSLTGSSSYDYDYDNYSDYDFDWDY